MLRCLYYLIQALTADDASDGIKFMQDMIQISKAKGEQGNSILGFLKIILFVTVPLLLINIELLCKATVISHDYLIS